MNKLLQIPAQYGIGLSNTVPTGKKVVKKSFLVRTLLNPQETPVTNKLARPADPIPSRDYLGYTYPDSVHGDNPDVRGEPDSSMLNRSEWWEMKYFLNKFTVMHCGGSRNSAFKVEELIQETIPTTLRSHANITDWLLRNSSLY